MKYKILLLIILSLTLNSEEVCPYLKIINKTNIFVNATYHPGKEAYIKPNHTIYIYCPEINTLRFYSDAFIEKTLVQVLLEYSLSNEVKEIYIDYLNGYMAFNLRNDKGKLVKQYIKKLRNVAAPGGDSEESKVNATPG